MSDDDGKLSRTQKGLLILLGLVLWVLVLLAFWLADGLPRAN